MGRGAPWAVPLSWLVPPRVAMQILLTGDPISAARAYEIGLVNQVVPDAELVPGRAGAGRAHRRQRPAVGHGRQAHGLPGAAAPAGRRVRGGGRIWAPVYHSADAQEGPAAFRDKRRPVWTGR